MADGNGSEPTIFSPTGRALTGMAADDQAAGLSAMGTKQDDGPVINRSVVNPRDDVQRSAFDQFVLLFATPGSPISPWGQHVALRDRQLRDFITAENYFNSALGVVSARNAALKWKITGDPATAEAAAEMVNNANFGMGWENFATTLSIDLYSQDNGAFVELVRIEDSPESPVVGFNQLDSARCFQTGNPEIPVIYEDREGNLHQMKWYQIVHLLEMPSGRTTGAGGYFARIQYCAMTRVLQAVEVMKAVTQYNDEKIGGRNARAIHLLTGVTSERVQDAIREANIMADGTGATHYMQPPMVGGVNLDRPVSHETLELASLPDGFNLKEVTETFITILAMGFLTDYQEFAPLAAGNIGTGAQSQTLHSKSRGKGSGLWQSLITRLMNIHGVLPRNVTFEFAEQDLEAEQQAAEIGKTRAETREIRVRTAELTVTGARQTALDDGDLSEELFEQMQLEDEEAAAAELETMMGVDSDRDRPIGDITPELTVEGTEPAAGLRSISPGGYVTQKAAGPVPFGQLISGRLHRAYATTSDDIGSLGYFEDTEQRKRVASAIGPALKVFEEDLREAGIFDIPIAPEDADRIVDVSLKALDRGFRQNGDSERADPERRAGPDEERLEFEEEVTDEIAAGLNDLRRRINARLRAADAASV